MKDDKQNNEVVMMPEAEYWRRMEYIRLFSYSQAIQLMKLTTELKKLGPEKMISFHHRTNDLIDRDARTPCGVRVS